MSCSETVRTAPRRTRSLEPSPSPIAPRPGVTVYGCGHDEAPTFRQVAACLGLAPTLTAAAPSEANIELARGSRCISIDHKTRIPNSTLLALRRVGVRYISTRSIGANHLDVAYARSVGIRVETVSYSADSVADYTLMLILMSIRHAKSTVRRTDAHDYRLEAVRGRELRDLTVGVVGTGRIGTAVIERLRGFGCRILAHDLCPTAPVEYADLDHLLATSDIVTLHTPLDSCTHHLLDDRRIALMKPGAVVVNTGRGALIDTPVLLHALETGRLGGAALDVLEGEDGIFYADCSDRVVEHTTLLRLQELPNVLISPHTAYYTDHALRDTIENSLANCLAFESEAHRG